MFCWCKWYQATGVNGNFLPKYGLPVSLLLPSTLDLKFETCHGIFVLEDKSVQYINYTYILVLVFFFFGHPLTFLHHHLECSLRKSQRGHKENDLRMKTTVSTSTYAEKATATSSRLERGRPLRTRTMHRCLVRVRPLLSGRKTHGK